MKFEISKIVSKTLVLCAFTGLGCRTDLSSNTDLNVDGPPMVQQVFANMFFQDGTRVVQEQAIVFGSHPDIEPPDGTPLNLVAAAGNEIRIIIDELLIGNSLEAVECADGELTSEYWNRTENTYPIPLGATPDDIADCAGEPQALLETCSAVCVGPNGVVDNLTGLPIGILDSDPVDGAPDRLALFPYEKNDESTDDDDELGVAITCDDVNIPIDTARSFWDPTGNQQIPAAPAAGTDAIGPVLVLFPQNGLRTGSTCTISFRDEVTDKDGNTICTPPDGDVTQDCAPGVGTSLITFDTEEFTLAQTNLVDGAMIDSTLPFTFIAAFSAPVSEASLPNVSLVDVATMTPVPFDPIWDAGNPVQASFEFDLGLMPATDYILTIPTTVTDPNGGPLAEENIITFSTL